MILRFLLLLFCFLLFADARATGKPKEPTPISNETLTGGIVHNDGYYLPRGMSIPVVLRTPIDTRVNQVKDEITVQTTKDIMIGDYVMIPNNSFIHGYIDHLEGPKKWNKRPKVSIMFDTVSLPGQTKDNRRFVGLRGYIGERQILDKSKRVNDDKLFKAKAKKVGLAGGLVGAVGAWGITELVDPFGSWGMVALANQIFILSSGVGGALIATSAMEKDDIRIEPGAEMEILLDNPTYEAFKEDHPLSQDHIKDLRPEEAYDKFGNIESESLKELKSENLDANKSVKGNII